MKPTVPESPINSTQYACQFGGRKTRREERKIWFKVRLFGFPDMLVTSLRTWSKLSKLRASAKLVTSLRETGEKMPYPIRQPARSREFAFAVIARANVDAFQNYFCLALYHDWNSELCFK